ncbi:prevent-host-death protein [Enterococcus plantarum]|uniref:Antitoxin n=1 Tax=Enterococcus plantarum TaxID=1077675 RepID=A0A2W3ZJ82_9ENTE|nr:type II toxin-antitoxin system Phd/YefM family antitoxin [Enterococcus plantarum]MBO0421462.1 type II toxin-antitoxin system Phd/YefM family antitoxin [Enterococcus plantarum]MBO0468484.1 type II toxin-antitoxin system Phd/YefM family antitoxin [Enterococcus plantarum]OEG20868.1 prevent-host-death protein [Enterococcus plantarum]PZL74154.1 type II toxin-antitoxin system Phd/YefM family antitoxin [Enterococcus plantarum]
MKNVEKKNASFSVTDVKQSPMTIFKKAKETNKGVYIYNRNKVAGVMLTVEQYEALIKKKTIEQDQEMKVTRLNQEIRQKIAFGSLISTKNLDDHLVSLGFITRKNESDDYIEMMNELNETGKIDYCLQKKEDRTTIFAEVIGEQSNQSHLSDKLIVKKIHLRVD